MSDQKPPTKAVTEGSFAVRVAEQVTIYRLVRDGVYERELEWRSGYSADLDELPAADYQGVTWEQTDTALWMFADDIELSSEPVATIEGTTDDRARLTPGSEFADRAVDVGALSAEVPEADR